jgi:hypothetical protein
MAKQHCILMSNQICRSLENIFSQTLKFCAGEKVADD